MDNYRMTVSRDRLAEFRRNSDVLAAKNGESRYAQQHRRTSMGPQHVPTYYRTPYQQTKSTLSYSDYGIHTEKYYLPDSSISSNIEHQSYDLASTEAFFLRIEEIKVLISKIKDNVARIESLRSSALSSINGEHSGQVNHTLENLVNQTSKLNADAKNCIKATEISNAKLSLNSSDQQMRATQLQAIKKKFVETIQNYQSIERAYEKQQRQRIERQIRIIKPEATPQEIELAIDSNDVPQIFAHSLLNSSRISNTVQVLDEVQTRHRDIKKIEKTILELHHLFLEMQQMVEMQQETIIEIEKSSENANHDLNLGNKQVTVAVSTAKSTRKRKWLCFVMFVILLVIVGILVWWFAFPKSRPTPPSDTKVIFSVNSNGNSTNRNEVLPNFESKQTNNL